jgi:hypothetical protein
VSRRERLRRHKEIVRLLFRSGRGGRDDAVTRQDAQVGPGAPGPDELPADLEKLAPRFITLGLLLSTGADHLLHEDAHRR